MDFCACMVTAELMTGEFGIRGVKGELLGR